MAGSHERRLATAVRLLGGATLVVVAFGARHGFASVLRPESASNRNDALVIGCLERELSRATQGVKSVRVEVEPPSDLFLVQRSAEILYPSVDIVVDGGERLLTVTRGASPGTCVVTARPPGGA